MGYCKAVYNHAVYQKRYISLVSLLPRPQPAWYKNCPEEKQHFVLHLVTFLGGEGGFFKNLNESIDLVIDFVKNIFCTVN